MRHEILFAPQAIQDLKYLSARERASVRDAIERHLRHEPELVSKSRIKRLRGISQPQYRLRVNKIRVFYNVQDKTTEILAIVPKSKAIVWLAKVGKEER